MSAITIEGGPTQRRQPPEIMSSGLALSAALHLGLIAVVVLGLPSLFSPPSAQPTPIAVDLVTIAPNTRATHPNPYRPEREARPIPAIAPPAPKPKPELHPQPAAAAMPATPPPPPPPPKPHPVEAKAPPPPPQPKPDFAALEKREMPQPKLHKVDARAFEKLLNRLDDRSPPDKLPPQPVRFDALLKNLTRQEAVAAEDAPPSPHQVAAAAEASSQPKAPLGSALTASQKDLIIQQIERCWDVPAGARDAKDLDIEVKAVVNQDGTVREAAVVDMARYASDPFFRAAADSAKRAVLNPRCSPLPVPADKYEAWHNLDLFFNPKDLL